MSVVAVGDSIVAADGSWPELIAVASRQECRKTAVGGATSTDALAQLDALGSGHTVGAVSVGTNDIVKGLDVVRFRENLARLLAALSPVCETVVVQTLPLRLNRLPGAANLTREVVAVNDVIAAEAAAAGALLLDASDLEGRCLSPDRIHPSHDGQALLATRAGVLLGVATPDYPRRPVATVRAVRQTATASLSAIRRRATQRHG